MGIMQPMSDEAEKKVIDGAPDVFVKGGTRTQKSEEFFERRYQEAEERRNVSEAEKRLAKIPIEKGGAQLQSSQFTSRPDIPKAYIPLTYVDSKGEPIVVNGEPVVCQADLIIGIDPATPMELTLIIVCPRCSREGVKHAQDCQLTIRQSNKMFEFVAGKGPETFVHDGKTFKSAGMIIQSEPFRCGDCGWRARIDRNRVWPD
jgi:hypothetical protein